MLEFLYNRLEKDDERMTDIYKLRYQVYCTECGFEKPEDHPGGMERDEYDEVSTHFCAFVQGTGEIIGTARIILPSAKGFPITRHFEVDKSAIADIDPTKVGEISRLAISKDFRRRVIEKAIYAKEKTGPGDENGAYKEKRRQFELALVAGLYRCIYLESRRLGLTHWYAVMAKGLYYLLKSRGIIWHPIGPSRNYHGLRRPYVAEIMENVKSAAEHYPEFLTSPPGWNVDTGAE